MKKAQPQNFKCGSCNKQHKSRAGRWIPYDEERNVKICRKCYNRLITLSKLILQHDKQRTS